MDRVKFSLTKSSDLLAQLGSKLELAMDADNRIGSKFRVSGYPKNVCGH